jgi:TRAP-type mannitol/chloroaromatic compound transport system substrate-binding protein
MHDITGGARERAEESARLDEERTSDGRGLSRRSFVNGLGLVAAGGLLAACAGDDDDADADADVATPEDTDPDAPTTTGNADLDEALQASDLPEIEWDMATSWPISLDTLYGSATFFAERVAAMTGGRFTINAAPAGELVPALEILQSVQTGAVASGHTASYYYVGIDPITQLSTCVPFGLNARGHLSWLMEGGGSGLLEPIFRDRFGVVPIPAGNTGCQMGGWFNKEINSVDDLGGLVFRIPGLGGTALANLGVNVQVLPGGEIYQALETGAIDGAEWVGPYDDLQLGLDKVSSYYYYPGWWEPGPSLDVMCPADEFDALPEEYQEVLRSAGFHAYSWALAKYDALNPPALQTIQDSGIEVRPYPDDVLQAASGAIDELLDEYAAADPDYDEVLTSYRSFRDAVGPWYGLAEKAMLDFNVG